MNLSLEAGIDRRGTQCLKWDTTPPGVLPMWVADMDFPCAPGIVDALRQRIAHPVFGYTRMGDDDKQAIVDYYARHHGMKLCAEEMLFTPGVVDSLLLAVHALTQPGDKVLIQSPVYGPFSGVIRRAKREIVENPLVQTESGRYEMDLADLDKRLAECKLMLLCSPHNPCGRVWERETLQTVLDLCKKHRVPLVADEIHCDLIRTGIKHIPLGKIMPDYNKLITTMSASKTFNLAGMLFSNIIIRSEEERARFNQRDKNIGAANPLSIAAHKAAYEQGDQWLTELKLYIDDNMKAVKEFLTQHLPDAEFEIPDATYFAWVDLQKVLPDVEDLPMFFANNAGVLLEGGDQLFVGNAKGYVRLNLAMPRAMLMTGLERIADAVKKHRA